MLTHSGTIAINIYIYAQCVVLIAGEKFVSFVELSVSLSLSWLEGIVQSDIHSCCCRMDVSAVVVLCIQ
jgi:hypothetical protein